MPQTVFPKPDDIVHCNRCGQDKFAADFNKDRTTRNGLQVWCRQCRHEYGTGHTSYKSTRPGHKTALIGSGVTIHAGVDVSKLPTPITPRNTAVSASAPATITTPTVPTIPTPEPVAPGSWYGTPLANEQPATPRKEVEKSAPPAEKTITLGEWLRNEESVTGRFTNGYGARLFVCESGQFAISRETSGGSYNLWHLTSEFKQAKDRAFSGADLTALLSYIAPAVLDETGRIYKR